MKSNSASRYNSVNTILKSKKNFEFPQKILDQINECSNGGFILFTIDEDGTPVAHSQCDTMTQLLALQSYVGTWSKTMEEMSVESLVASIIPEETDDDDSE